MPSRVQSGRREAKGKVTSTGAAFQERSRWREAQRNLGAISDLFRTGYGGIKSNKYLRPWGSGEKREEHGVDVADTHMGEGLSWIGLRQSELTSVWRMPRRLTVASQIDVRYARCIRQF
ncbi:uncharacterized protein CIMG_07116 [Coccidioides immitis RS]|uniref:Uncharacterized protein n=1 Tax=Coccidioides immitis (strain RS) TaxID=246410 RepID=J3K9N5_COCIM|nr:uncharacterized protein CIMG_07116 [Coccidioides immitis RS]EAS31637.3 hypothetical protein CIMG_07116 [Coccidioides immitis RS]